MIKVFQFNINNLSKILDIIAGLNIFLQHLDIFLFCKFAAGCIILKHSIFNPQFKFLMIFFLVFLLNLLYIQ